MTKNYAPVRYAGKNHTSNYPISLPKNTFNFNSIAQNYMKTGKRGDRNFIGTARREVILKNGNGQTMTFRESHNFINVNKHTNVNAGSRRGSGRY